MKITLKILLLKVSLVALTCVFLLPTAVKLSHAFNHHKHQVCYGDNQVHFHALDLDCEFYKFKLQTESLSLQNYEDDNVEEPDHFQIKSVQKDFYSTTETHYNLRAPPTEF